MLGEGRNPCTGERAVGVFSAAAGWSALDPLSTLLNEVAFVQLTGQVIPGGHAIAVNQLPACDGNLTPSLVQRSSPCNVEQVAGVSLSAAAPSKCDHMSILLNEVDLVELSGQAMPRGDTSGVDQLPMCVY